MDVSSMEPWTQKEPLFFNLNVEFDPCTKMFH